MRESTEKELDLNMFIHFSVSTKTRDLFELLCLERLPPQDTISWASNLLRAFFPSTAVVSCLPVVVPAISGLVAVPVTTWGVTCSSRKGTSLLGKHHT